LPMVPRGWPYSIFLLSVSGKIFRTKVAFVSVGAGTVNQSVTRWLFNSAARLAYYRSYRDTGAREAMRKRGLDVSRDHVFPDLAFALPPPADGKVEDQLVAVGVMAYYGTNDERKQADEIYARYVAGMKKFVLWLIDNNRRVLLMVGDTNGSDGSVVQEILEDVRANRPDLDPSAVTAASVSSYSDVMRALMPANSVVAIRYHNILCALKLSKPTISISYSPKHNVLMADMGLPEFCQDVSTLDVDELIKLFTELEGRSAELRRTLAERNAAKAKGLSGQFAELSAALFPSAGPTPVAAVREPAA
jgi:polysaccharide pyruvyl transferase WcaK-like protein